MKYFALVITMTILGAMASFFLKKSADEERINKFVSRNFLVGGSLYFISAVFNIVALKHLAYSQVLPLTSITYIWTFLLARIFLKEKMSWPKLVGVGMIIVGAVLIAI